MRSERRKLHVLTLDGVTPDAASIANGSYRYIKILFLVTSPTMSPVARACVEFIRSDSGRAVLLIEPGRLETMPTRYRIEEHLGDTWKPVTVQGREPGWPRITSTVTVADAG